MNLILSNYLNNNLLHLVGKYNLQDQIKFSTDLLYDIQVIKFYNTSIKDKIQTINYERFDMMAIEKDMKRDLIYFEFDD